MKGYRTLLLGLAIAVLPAALNYLAGVHWTDYVNPELAGFISGAIVIFFRAVSTTPMGQGPQSPKP